MTTLLRIFPQENPGPSAPPRTGRLPFLLLLLFTPLWMELVFRAAALGGIFCETPRYLLPLALSLGAGLALLCSLGSARVNRALALLLTLLLFCLFGAVVTYRDIFGVFPSLYSLRGAGQAARFLPQVALSVGHNGLWLLLLSAPAVALLCGFGRGRSARLPVSGWLSLAAVGLFLRILALVLILSSSGGMRSPRELYLGDPVPARSVRLFGAVTTAQIDLRTLLIGPIGQLEPDLPASPPASPPAAPQPAVEYNVTALDFDALAAAAPDPEIAALHRYFGAQQPSKKNDYTGKFAGKNLILITAESWSPYAVSEERTPTLYGMLHDGFVFEHFYNPIWGTSTTDGEYAICTGLIPKAGVWAMLESADHLMPFCLGNQFRKIGYSTRAYHDHDADFYRRDLSHPNMGYDFKAKGMGLAMDPSNWPESDLEMIELTADEFIADPPFHTYYMTVSGHLPYDWGNSMASRHHALFDQLPIPAISQVYLAASYELELAVTELMARLEAAGLAEDTVLVISPDHYPYGLPWAQISEFKGLDRMVDEVYELYESCLLIYCKGMEPVVVEKPCSSLDILPTLSNLFGLEYDSRLLMGRDILSDADPLILFEERSWIAKYGRYNAINGVFEPFVDQSELPADYVGQMNSIVKNKFSMSAKLLDSDYYRVLFDPDTQTASDEEAVS